MKKLYLHIGMGKTGSSALQSWLSLNAEALSRQGVDYADLVPEAKHGAISSGNGYLLCKACVQQDFEEVERLITSTYFFSGENDTAIVSSESLQGIRIPYMQEISDICARHDIDITVIAYARSVYEKAYSVYLQDVKTRAISSAFGEAGTESYVNTWVTYLKRYFKVFGDRLMVLNYDVAKRDIYSSFAGVTGIDTLELEKPPRKVNRSLTFEEAEVLRRMNALHEGRFSKDISDFVIALNPEVETPVLYDKRVVDAIRTLSEADLRWINGQFQVEPSLVSDFYTGQDTMSSVALTSSSYQPVLRWALEYEPGAERLDDYLRFLGGLAELLAELSPEDALALRSRAVEVTREPASNESPDAVPAS